jgi:hypothetical protein
MEWYWTFLLGVAASPFVVAASVIVFGVVSALAFALTMKVMGWLL